MPIFLCTISSPYYTALWKSWCISKMGILSQLIINWKFHQTLKGPVKWFQFINIIKVYITMNFLINYQNILVHLLSVIFKNKNWKCAHFLVWADLPPYDFTHKNRPLLNLNYHWNCFGYMFHVSCICTWADLDFYSFQYARTERVNKGRMITRRWPGAGAVVAINSSAAPAFRQR